MRVDIFEFQFSDNCLPMNERVAGRQAGLGFSFPDENWNRG